MASNLLDTTVEDILHDVFDAGGAEFVVVNPSEDTIEQLVEVSTAYDDELPSIRMLAQERTLKDVMDDFIVASNAADLIDEGVLTMRATEETPENSLLITDDRVIALVTAGETVAGLTTDDAEFVGTAVEAYDREWDDASEFNLRTPPLTRVRQTLGEDISPEAEDAFDAVLASLDTARGDGDGLDEVTISLLVAAKNEELLYDISKWGEDVGIASKATFSRTKTRLEDMGIIDTEKVPIDVGRPRLRLKLGRDELKEADADQLAGVATSILH
ncbi:hypothetical protein BRC81_09200 [Halobacteriales archaeon QS_1_68_20]|nr:MAG: hypothetical protein BRC81_09200 [Halobacteriales archaeon QS_1_68_20]